MEIRSIWLKSMKQHFATLKGDTLEQCFSLPRGRHRRDVLARWCCLASGWVPFVLSVCVLAGGASEFMFIGIVASGNPLAAAAAGLLVNARHIPSA